MSKLMVPLAVTLLFAVLLSVTVAVAVGLGFVLNWLVPAVGLDTSMLIITGAMVFWGLLAFAFVLSTVAISRQRFESSDDSDADDSARDENLEIHAELVADRLVSALSDQFDFGRRRRR